MVRVLIADDHKPVRDNLRAVVSEQQPFWEIFEATNGTSAIEEFRKVGPDVVVLDIVMPDMGGVAAAYEIRRINPDSRIIFISSHYTVRDAGVITRLLGSGAFVPKADAVKSLVPAIKKILT